EIGVTTVNGTARLSVVDHGPGLKAGDLDRIFEPFFRADPSRSRDSGGAGLGLSIVSAVVAAHGGRVQVKETSGGGATFEVELPLPSKPSSDRRGDHPSETRHRHLPSLRPPRRRRLPQA